MRGLILGAVAALSATPAFAATCESLAGKTLADTKIVSAVDTAPFANTDPMFGPFKVEKRFCRVSGTIAPAIKFEVWLPEPGTWNGKLQGVGNGGVAGSIAQGSLAAALGRGYAAVSSNLGHDGGPSTSISPSAIPSWSAIGATAPRTR
jgi:feruloyl esterase